MSTVRVVKPTLFLVSAIVLMAIPLALIALVGWQSAGLLASLSAISAVFNAMGMGWRGVFWGTAFTTVAVFCAVLFSTNPLASAALMLVVGVVFGWSNTKGFAASNLVLPMIVAATIGTPPAITHNVSLDALISAGIAAGSMLIAGGIVMMVLTMQHHVPQEIVRYSTKVHVVYTFNLSVLWAIIGYFTALHQAQVQGMWLALTVVLIVRPYLDVSIRRGFERAGGTMLGFLIAIGVATSIPATGLYYAVGLLFIELALIAQMNARDSYWLFVMFLTPGVVLLSGPPSEVTQYADWRLVVTMIAVAGCLLLLGIERLLFYKGSLNKAAEVLGPTSAAS